MSKDECRRALRSLELETYSNVVAVLRAQGALGPEKKKLLQEMASALNIPMERHKAEIRKAVNDEKLNTIAEVLFGPHTAIEWAIEGRRLVPLLPREPPKTIYSIIADQAASHLVSENSRLGAPSETANKANEFPMLQEPSSPEPAKTQPSPLSPSGVLVLPCGTAIQMKRELDEDDIVRKKRKTSITLDGNSKPALCPSSPPPSSKVIIVSSSESPGTSSILQKTLSVPIKTVPSSSKPTMLCAQTLPLTSTSSTTETSKIRPKSITSASIPKPRSSAIVVSNQGSNISSQILQLNTKPNPSGSVPHLKTALQTTKHTVPIQTISGMQVKTQSPQSKILVQQKTVSRTMPKALQQKTLSSPQHKTIHTTKTGQVGVVVQQKQTKGIVQVKTPQGFTNMPVNLRTAAKSQGLQIKHDSGSMKMLSISGGTKILPKPSQPLYMVSTSTSALSMVTRTIPASSSPRGMAVSSGTATPKTSQPSIFTPNKPVQRLHFITQPPAARRQNVVLLQKSSTPKNIPIAQTRKEIVGKVAMPKTSQVGVAKPVTTLSTNSLAQSLQNLPVTQTQSGSVILLDLSNQESMTKNAAIAELLQASGLLGDSATVVDKSKRLTSGDDVEIVSGPESQVLDVEEKELKTDEEVAVKDTGGTTTSAPTLSIEEAVEMLNRSDTPETRALLSQAGIQISDEIGDSEEEEVMEVKADDTDFEEEMLKKDSTAEGSSLQVDQTVDSFSQSSTSESDTVVATTSGSVTPATTLTSTRPKSMDIFSTALASANINLDNFMEEEDEPEQGLTETTGSPKSEETSAAPASEATEQSSDLGEVTSEPDGAAL
ncbi:hypothetical protein RUM43_009144 [Polyplax serrata]|uniref:ENT domain-containing protein n=1 Tax=Polyplax serrata TaxID=468196 RepID=A0AAN8NVI8_POLSC